MSLLLCSNGANAQQWTTDTLSKGRTGLAAASVGTKVFFAGGDDGTSFSKRVDIYDNSTGLWHIDSLSIGRGAVGGGAVGTKVFFAGGNTSTGSGVSKVVDIYNNATNTWTTVSLFRARSHIAVTTLGDKIFFAGGDSNSVVSAVVDIYDTSSNTWSNATLSQARTNIAAGSIGTKAMFGGGYKGSAIGVSDDLDIYDNVSGLWTTYNGFSLRTDAAAATIGSNLIFAGGQNNSSVVGTIDIYKNTNPSSWTTSLLPQARDNLAAASLGKRAYFGGGTNSAFALSNTVYIYDSSTSSWSSATLSQARTYAAAAVVGNKLFFAGGDLGGSVVSKVVDIYNCSPTAFNVTGTGSYCAGGSGLAVGLSGSTSGATYQLYNGASTVGAAVSGTGSAITFGNQTAAGTYTVVGTSVAGCTGTMTGSAIITVNPIPTVTFTPSTQTICSGSASSISLTSGVAGTTFTWGAPNVSNLTGASVGSGNTIAQTLTLTGTNSGYAVYNVSPAANGCTGSPALVTVNVYPVPNAIAGTPSQSVCSGVAIATVLLSGSVTGTTYNWTRSTATGVSGINITGSGNISGTLTNSTNAPITITFTITPTTGTCTGTPITATVTVKPIPIITVAPSTSTICSGSTTSVALTSGVVGTNFAWTVTPSGVTGATAAGGNNIAQILNGSGNIYYNITSTANACQSTSVASVNVNPLPTAIANPSAQTFCSGIPFAPIMLSGTGTGTIYSWTRDNTASVTGMPSSGTTSNSITGTLTNTTNAPVTVTFTIVPVGPSCTGTAITATVIVKPIPAFTASPSTSTICALTSTSIALTSGVAGTTFSWTATPSGVTGASGASGNNIAQSLNGSGNVSYNITSTANGCQSTSTAIVNVNPSPSATASPATQNFCPTDVIPGILLSGGGNGTVYNWTRDNTTTVTGSSSGSGSYIGASLSNTTGAPVTVTYTIIPMATNGCSGAPVTATIVVKPYISITATPDMSAICSGTSTSIALTSNISGITFSWTPNAYGVTGASSGSGNNIVQTLSGSGEVDYDVSYSAFGCIYEATPTVYVNPVPNVTATPSTQSICSNTSISTITMTGSVSGTTYNWTRDNTTAVTGIGASGSGNISGTLVNTTGAPVTVTFTITPTISGGCSGTPVTSTVIVRPTPVATATPSASSICSGTPTSIALTSNVSGTTFTWTVSASANVTGASSGSGNTIAQTLTGSGVDYYIIIPTANGCQGALSGASVDVTAGAYASASPMSQAVCSGTAINMIAVSGNINNASYVWTRNNTATVTGMATSGTGNISGTLINNTTAPITVTFTITPVATACSINSTTATVVVNPLPAATAMPTSQTICSGTATSIGITSNIAGSTFAWMPNATTITGASSGTGNTIAQTLTNLSATAAGSVSYSIIPVLNGCSGAAVTATMQVNPLPLVTLAPGTQAICSGAAIYISLSSTVPGGSLAWTVSAPNITGASSGNGNSIAQTLTNTNTASSSATYNIMSVANGCTGPASVATVTVKPTPNAIAGTPTQNSCSGTAINTITLSGNVAGTTYSWTRDNTTVVTGINASGAGNISGTLTNTTTAPVSVTFTITPTANGCPGIPITSLVIVNPTPVALVSPAAQTICSGSITSIGLTSTVAGTTFSWTSNPTNTMGASSSTGNNIAQVLTTTSPASGSVAYFITPVASGCTGAAENVNVTVNPIPVAVAGTPFQTICSGAAINIITLTGNVAGTTYNWIRDNTSVVTGITNSSSANIGGNLINTTNAPVTVSFITTPTANGCTGAPITATVLVNPNPTAVASPNSLAICSGASTSIALSGPVSGTTFAWTSAQADVSGALPGYGNIITQPLSTTTSSVGTATYLITPTANGCSGTPATATVVVSPIPTILIANGAASICSGGLTSIALVGTGISFSWTVVQSGVSGATGGSSTSISQQLTATGATPGTATYFITPAANGCTGSPVSTIVAVTPDNTANLASPLSTASQTVCFDSTINPILYNTTGATDAVVTGLPTGVTGHWQANTVTISGAPHVAGSFTYTVTLIGGCGTVIKTGTITVTPPNTITLSSAPGSSIQAVCVGAAITPVTYAFTGAASASVVISPAGSGIVANTTNNTVTISGAPTLPSATYTYVITLNGGCGNITASGAITSVTNNTVVLSSSSGTDSQSVCRNNPITPVMYAITGATSVIDAGLPPGVQGYLSGNIYTIAGIPDNTATGVYNYTIALHGGCSTGTVTIKGKITIVTDNIMTLTSGPGTDSQALCVNAQITPITYLITGNTTVTPPNFAGTGLTFMQAGNVLTISGAPTSLGVINYSITISGGCGNAVTKYGIVRTVTEKKIDLSSDTATKAQTVCVNTQINNIIYATAGATGADFLGLPTGVTGIFAGNTAIISGTPVTAGIFNYTVKLNGGCGDSKSAYGMIIVHQGSAPEIAQLDFDKDTICKGSENIAFHVLLPVDSISYLWSSDPSNISIRSAGSPNAIISFPDTGNFAIRVVAINGFGCSDSAVKKIVVTPSPGIDSRSIFLKQPGNILVYPDNSLDSGRGYQWGYDSVLKMSPRAYSAGIITPGQVYQFFTPDARFLSSENVLDTTDRAFWVLLHDGECFSRVYYNGPNAPHKMIATPPEDNTVRLTVIPNPNDGHFRFSLLGNIYGYVHCVIYNSLGQAISNIYFKKITSAITQQLDIDHLADGMYYIQATGDDLKATQTRFIIQH